MSIWLREIQLKNFINVKSGKITIDKENPIIGIYGPNGSGKTTVVKAIKLFYSLFDEGFDAENCAGLISYGENKATLKFCFDLREDGNWRGSSTPSYSVGRFEYTFSIRENGGKAFLCSESISYKTDSSSSHSFSLPVGRRTYKEDIEYLVKLTKILRPYEKDNILLKLIDSYKVVNKENKAFFSENVLNMLESTPEDPDGSVAWNAIASIEELTSFIENDVLFIDDNIISDLRSGGNSLQKEIDKYLSIISAHSDEGKTKLSFDRYREQYMKRINDLVSQFIPNLEFLIEKKDGQNSWTLFSLRNGIEKNPITNESYGICKLYKLCAYINTMIDHDTLLVVDELDEGLHEYLVGSILSFLKNQKKGILIFTAHNLRPLQILDKRSIVFSTQNPQKRYTNMKNIKKTNSLKESYIRQLSVGSLDENSFSYEIDQNMMLLAFLSAADLLCAEEDDE